MKKQKAPGLSGVEHVGFAVANPQSATRFFVDVLGRNVFYDSGPFKFTDGNWMTRHHNERPRAEIRNIRFLRCGHGPIAPH